MRRGDVVTVAERGGDFTGKPRPAVIIQSDLFAALDSVTICPLTSSESEAVSRDAVAKIGVDREPIQKHDRGRPPRVTVIEWTDIDVAPDALRSKCRREPVPDGVADELNGVRVHGPLRRLKVGHVIP